MADNDKKNTESENSPSPLIFISHDSRDAEIAEAFSKLLKSVSAGMLKSFRSSDKIGTEGIQFGDDWYKRLMSKLDTASDVVCLLTERSLDRPWILYEAGVAKGKLETPVHGIALGIALSRVSTGPFYQFQNSDDSEESLSKLVLQLCNRIPGLEPDKDVVRAQVQSFKKKVEELTKSIDEPKKPHKKITADEGAVAKVLEEMKLMLREFPMRIERSVIGGKEYMPRKFRRFHPMMLDEMVHMVANKTNDPLGILIIASVVREDFPWLYEIGIEAYRSAKTGDHSEFMESLRMFRKAADFTLRGPFIDEFGLNSKEANMMRELPMIIDHYIERLDKPIPKRTIRRRIKREDETESS